MRAYLWMLVASLVQTLIVALAAAQPPDPGGKAPKIKNSQGPLDEEKEILKEIKEAYKAQYEVHKDVLSELRKQYKEPTPQREAKIVKELRRLYLLSPQQEDGIIREVRRAYDKPSPEQEERIFRLFDDFERLPTGMVPPSVQTSQAQKIFAKLDLNGDGRLTGNEVPEALWRNRARWDANRDGAIDAGEYWQYYLGRLDRLGEQVAGGQIDLFPNRARPAIEGPTQPDDEPRLPVHRPGKLPDGVPDWFVKFDTDRDAQIGLYEWRKTGRPLRDFFAMDRNRDGFVTVEEVLRFLKDSGQNPAAGISPIPSPGNRGKR